MKTNRSRAQRAFTLMETMMTMTVFVLVLGGIVISNLIGLHLYEVSKAKLGSTDEARNALSLLFDDVRSAKIVRVGEGSQTGFAEVAGGVLQQGNALQVYPTASPTNYSRYFQDTNDSTLKRLTSSNAVPAVLVNAVSNYVVFTAEDFLGNTLTNQQNNRVIGLSLQIFKLRYPAVAIGTGGLFSSYQLRTKMTRRTLD
jgi:type II secretory pathway pseudopilin PulG